MFEHRTHPLLSTRQFARRMGLAVALSLSVIGASLTIGVLGYHVLENLTWLDSLVEASMILAGEGPLHPPQTRAGKVFASFYALFAGIMFITTAATLLTPILHRVMHKLHLPSDEGDA